MSQWKMPEGVVTLYVGHSSADVRLTGALSLDLTVSVQRP